MNDVLSFRDRNSPSNIFGITRISLFAAGNPAACSETLAAHVSIRIRIENFPGGTRQRQRPFIANTGAGQPYFATAGGQTAIMPPFPLSQRLRTEWPLKS